MPEKLQDRWTDRDFPVLMAAAEILEAGALAVASQQLAEASQLPRRDVVVALSGLRDVYLTVTDANSYDGRDYLVRDLTERGRRIVGLWPGGDSQIDAFIKALRQAEETATDPHDRGALHRAAGALASISRDLVTDVVAAMARAQIGV